MSLMFNPGMNSSNLMIKQWIPAKFPTYRFFRICITSLFSPSNFYFHFRHSQHNGALQEMEKDMKVFYDKFKKSLKFKSVYEIIKVKYAVISFNKYYRRVFVKNLRSERNRLIATIFHCDYGDTTQIPITELLQMRQELAYFPQQAIWAALDGINPVKGGTRWNHEASAQFATLVQNKFIRAKITGFDKDIMKLSLILEDISNPIDEINVNDTIVNLGFANSGPTLMIEK